MGFMKQFSASDVKHLATLSGLSLVEGEIDSIGVDLNNIITYINKLDELDVDGVEPTYQLTDLENVFGDDRVDDQLVSPQQLMAITPESADNQIKVPKVL